MLAHAQAAAGHEVAVLVTNPAGMNTTSTHEDGVRVVRAARLATVASTPLSLALPWRLSRESPDIVHLHFPYPVGEVSQWLFRRGRRSVMTYHSDIVRQSSVLRFYRPLMRRVLSRMDAIVAGSPPMARSEYLLPMPGKVHVIPYGIPLARFAEPPAPDILAQARARYRPASGKPVLLFVGRLRYYKGLDTLLAALPRIDADARLLVAGTGPMAREWQALAANLGLEQRIRWLGEVSDGELPALYRSADLYVLPAGHRSEAFGLAMVEAMASGLPAVCTELGTGTSYINVDGLTGRVVPPRDPGALATAINDLLADPEQRLRMGAAAREHARSEFAAETMVARVLALYDLILPLDTPS